MNQISTQIQETNDMEITQIERNASRKRSFEEEVNELRGTSNKIAATEHPLDGEQDLSTEFRKQINHLSSVHDKQVTQLSEEIAENKKLIEEYKQDIEEHERQMAEKNVLLENLTSANQRYETALKDVFQNLKDAGYSELALMQNMSKMLVEDVINKINKPDNTEEDKQISISENFLDLWTKVHTVILRDNANYRCEIQTLKNEEQSRKIEIQKLINDVQNLQSHKNEVTKLIGDVQSLQYDVDTLKHNAYQKPKSLRDDRDQQRQKILKPYGDPSHNRIAMPVLASTKKLPTILDISSQCRRRS